MEAGQLNRALPRPDVIVPGGLARRKVTIHLNGGPCDDVYTTVLGFGTIAWQRIPGKTPYWAKYVRTAQAEYTFDGEVIGLVEMAAKIAAQGRGRVMGSHGA